MLRTEEDMAVTLSVLRLLRAYMHSEKDEAAVAVLQDQLAACSVMQLVADLLAPGIPQRVQRDALELAILVLDGRDGKHDIRIHTHYSGTITCNTITAFIPLIQHGHVQPAISQPATPTCQPAQDGGELTRVGIARTPRPKPVHHLRTPHHTTRTRFNTSQRPPRQPLPASPHTTEKGLPVQGFGTSTATWRIMIVNAQGDGQQHQHQHQHHQQQQQKQQ